jgi:single-strand DNA-binding protein
VPSKGLVHCAANRRPTEDAAIAEWADKPNYFDVVVWAALGSENAARYMTKGRGVAIDGRLDWREDEARDGSTRRR